MEKTIEIIILVILIAITAFFYIKERKKAYLSAKQADENIKKQKEAEASAKVVLTVKIDGMMCEKCAARVTEGLSKFGEISINLEEKTATIISNEMQDVVEIENTVNELGYKFEGVE